MYIVKTPFWLKLVYKKFIWNIKESKKILYLTFDDGPHITATQFVLDQLKKYNAKATFFCIGKNVLEYPYIFERVLAEGHSVGNHTFNHLNGWKTKDDMYIKNIMESERLINSNLFRPPYGRIRKSQAKKINEVSQKKYKIIMWDVLSGDFDLNISKEQCLQNVLSNCKNGSIIVFHDSSKAWERMSFALPKVLEYFSKKGFVFEKL